MTTPEQTRNRLKSQTNLEKMLLTQKPKELVTGESEQVKKAEVDLEEAKEAVDVREIA